MRLVLFDCDGTIADSFAVICSTMRDALVRQGVAPPSDEAIHRIIGLSLPEAMHRLVGGISMTQAQELAERYRESFRAARQAGLVDEPLYDGMADLVRQLAQQHDVVIGMVTGKSRIGARNVLEAHGLEDLFQVVRTADDCPSKPDPAMVLECCEAVAVAPARTVVVGDASFDMAMASAAGAMGLGVAWGACTPEQLLQAGAAHVAEDVAHLELLLHNWAGAPASRTGTFS
ncbi:HAD-IA family hydrolase [Aureimonas fodinaquatilis]|uniref:HAD-IA family hydrolase n=1 Tax=Aureimonas fodinaquatilis TaxID=2565783 RepID=A0A5B0DY98_9HYPH|nr:HAD-IA family hydrolase [Aureimonas fodinaquatilis]KAA0970855.1 HAD-IA family hydrolase [Aureimonas fodinaquatilis]